MNKGTSLTHSAFGWKFEGIQGRDRQSCPRPQVKLYFLRLFWNTNHLISDILFKREFSIGRYVTKEFSTESSFCSGYSRKNSDGAVFKTQVWSWVDVLRSSAVVLETDFGRPALGAGRKGACSVSSPGGYRTLSERHCGRTAAQPGLPPPQEYFLTEKEVKHKNLKTF